MKLISKSLGVVDFDDTHALAILERSKEVGASWEIFNKNEGCINYDREDQSDRANEQAIVDAGTGTSIEVSGTLPKGRKKR
jgi:hypothetical protein